MTEPSLTHDRRDNTASAARELIYLSHQLRKLHRIDLFYGPSGKLGGLSDNSHPQKMRRGYSIIVAVRCLTFALCLSGMAASMSWGQPSSASPIAGHARVVDGDTLEISGLSIRLEGIDAPDMVTFSGMGRRQVKVDADTVIQPIDILIFSYKSKPSHLDAVGECRFRNPETGRPSPVACTATTKGGLFEAAFVSDGRPPDVVQ